jgi:myo-inositol-1-phosphate synthase
MPNVKIALIGVGNCASALLQGIQYYGEGKDTTGLRNPKLGGLAPSDLRVVAAFDVDDRKVGKDLSEAVFAKPNNAPKVVEVPKIGVTVQKGPLLDGVGESTSAVVKVSKASDVDVTKVLRQSGAEVVVNLLPSGPLRHRTSMQNKLCRSNVHS